MVVIGVDAHKRTHTAAVVEEATARALKDITVPADGDGHLQTAGLRAPPRRATDLGG